MSRPTVHKPRAANLPTLGRDALSKKTGKPMRIPAAKVSEMARQAQHGRCFDHVEVAGLDKPVCILWGQDPEAVVAEARELAGAE
ncbi:MAG: hypothetical protein IT341_10450 [Chloroflexi bacterium]|nr:hypothetical protein [Chloroflexota bacterium]